MEKSPKYSEKEVSLDQESLKKVAVIILGGGARQKTVPFNC